MRRDGTRIAVEFSIAPLKDSCGRMEGMAALMQDATKCFDEVRALNARLAAALSN